MFLLFSFVPFFVLSCLVSAPRALCVADVLKVVRLRVGLTGGTGEGKRMESGGAPGEWVGMGGESQLFTCLFPFALVVVDLLTPSRLLKLMEGREAQTVKA